MSEDTSGSRADCYVHVCGWSLHLDVQLTFAKEIGQFEDFHHQAIMVAAVNLPSMLRRGLYLTEGNRLQDRPVDVGGAHPLGTYAMLIKDKRWLAPLIFSPLSSRKQAT